jgi:hypothetical protein
VTESHEGVDLETFLGEHYAANPKPPATVYVKGAVCDNPYGRPNHRRF